jgi:hypothetical protein
MQQAQEYSLIRQDRSSFTPARYFGEAKMWYLALLFREHLIGLLENVLDFCFIVTDFEAYLLKFLSRWVYHPNLEFAVRGVRVIPLLSDGPDDLFALMHFLDSKLH